MQPFSQLGTLLGLEVEARGGVPLGKSVLARVFREETTPMICVRSRGCRRAIIWLGLCCAILGSANTARGDVISVTNLVTDDQAPSGGGHPTRGPVPVT